jgi:CRISPR system Cascade subunit CasC
MHNFGAKLAVRTKHVGAMIEQKCLNLGAKADNAAACAAKISESITKDTLLFFSETEASAFADYAKQLEFDSSKVKDKEVFKVAKQSLNMALDGTDIAFFGRMVAQAAELNVEAAASFAHAISTHKVANEVEFFTALDDCATDPGSAHMGTLEFNSATYYRYVSVDLGQLFGNMHGEMLSEAMVAFTKALFVAVPAARQTTQSGASPWEHARILVRRGQGIQIPFETAVKARDGGYLAPSIEALTDYLAKHEYLHGSLYGKIADYTYGDRSGVTIDGLVDSLRKEIDKLLSEG